MGAKAGGGVGAAHLPRLFDPFGSELECAPAVGCIDAVEDLHRSAVVRRGAVKKIGLMGALS